jgi:hypothetical protein
VPTPPDRPFVDPSIEPTDEAVESTLGASSGHYRSILRLCPGFGRAWTYSKGSGWLLKVSDRQKALVYLIPLREAFKANLTIREAERDAFLADPAFAALQPQLTGARKLPEGFALYFDVDASSDAAPLLALIEKLVAARA